MSNNTIQSFEEYHARIIKILKEESDDQSDDRFYFRGVQKMSYELIPKVGRGGHEMLKQEEDMFERFKNSGRTLTQHSSNNLEWLYLAQHHGLPTRLLDWTTNPMVALYFAVEHLSKDDDKKRSEDCAVFVLKVIGKKKKPSKDEKKNPFAVQDVLVLSPPAISKRIIAQSAMFTIQPKPAVNLRDQVHSDKMHIDKIIISKDSCDLLRKIIARYGCHPFAMFPDLDGLAKHISLFLEWPVKLKAKA